MTDTSRPLKLRFAPQLPALVLGFERRLPAELPMAQVLMGPPGPPGPGGGSTYTHAQEIPLPVWTAAHNLGRFPSVSVVDTLGRQVFADVAWVDENIVQITHGSAIAGKAYFN